MNIAILGAGNVGLAFANLLQSKGHLVSLGSRKPDLFKRRLSKLNTNHSFAFNVCDYSAALEGAELTLLAVPDNAIQSVCAAIADKLTPGTIIAHFSGALDSSILNAAYEHDLHCCSIHPLNSFPNLESSLQLYQPGHASFLVCEGDSSALNISDQLFAKCDFELLRIDATAKPFYHAASVFACNYLSVLMDASLVAGAQAGLDKETLWRALQPLIRTTLDNIGKDGAAKSLSGPIARGDHHTVKLHLDALNQASPPLAALYASLGRQAIKLVEERGSLDQASIVRLTDLLK